MGQGQSFEVIEHTADVGIIAYGDSLEELFENAARGMFSLMAELATVKDREGRHLDVSAEDWESLLAAWLSSLLYYVDAEGLLLSSFHIQRLEPYELHARVGGEPIDPDSQELHYAVKAVTRHQMELRHQDRWSARIIFDI